MTESTSSQYQATSAFDEKKAGANFSIAVLPIMYERALNDGMSADEAHAAVGKRIAQGDSFEVVRHGNVTAVIVHQTKSAKITVAYDGTEELRDRIDNMRFSGHDHPLGGKVHTGFFKAIAREDGQGKKISDRVKEVVERFASSGEGVTDLTITGHSRGGTLGVATAAGWMNEGLPAKTRLTDVQTFGSLPYGNEAFKERFMQESAKNNTQISRVIAGADAVPSYMISKNMFSDMFTHAGDVVYLLPSKEDTKASALVNPKPELLAKELSALKRRDWHNPDTYAEMLGVPAAKLPPSIGHPYKDLSLSELQTPLRELPPKQGATQRITPA